MKERIESSLAVAGIIVAVALIVLLYWL